MVKAAFYAPMKSPNHVVPSGDRAMARALICALQYEKIDTVLASELQTRDGIGDRAAQAAIRSQTRPEIDRLISKGGDAGWSVWITYHNYYKAPDLIGPEVTKALGIPYILVESTRARKRLSGPWADFAVAAEAATDAAQVVFYFTKHDEEALRSYATRPQTFVKLPPFLPRTDLPPETARDGGLLCVGMFRAGDKIASYQIIADTLDQLEHKNWVLRIAGDGPERAQVERMMSPFGERVEFLGALDRAQMQQAYTSSAILFWPGVNEAFGMSYLEAQAAGLTVVAQDRPGVRDVLAPGAAYPLPDQGSAAVAARLDMLLQSPKLVMHLGQKARAYVEDNHLMTQAGSLIRKTIEEQLR